MELPRNRTHSNDRMGTRFYQTLGNFGDVLCGPERRRRLDDQNNIELPAKVLFRLQKSMLYGLHGS